MLMMCRWIYQPKQITPPKIIILSTYPVLNTDGFPFPMRANNMHLLEYTVTFD